MRLPASPQLGRSPICNRPARETFAAQLADASRDRPVVWISGEGPGVVSAFAHLEFPEYEGIEQNVLGAIQYEGGDARATALAFVHPHGASIDWIA